MSELLKAVSNVIELKPNHKYLLVLRGPETREEAHQELIHALQAQGVGGVMVHITEGQSLDIVEVPPITEQEVNDLAVAIEQRIVSRMKYGRSPLIEVHQETSK